MSDFVNGLIVGGIVGGVAGAIAGGKVVFDKTAEFYHYDQNEIIEYYKNLAKVKEEETKAKIDNAVDPIKTKINKVKEDLKSEPDKAEAEAAEPVKEEVAKEEPKQEEAAPVVEPEVEKVSGEVIL